MTILSGNEIKKEIDNGNITIEPFNKKQVQPISYDLRLGRGIRVYNINDGMPLQVNNYNKTCDLTSMHENLDGIIIYPGTLYLAHTVERITTNKYVPVIDGKSSNGRLGVFVHITAGVGDPGFNGQWTLEITCVHKIKLLFGMLIAQIRFFEIKGEVSLYDGNYTGENSIGAVSSRSYKQYVK